MTLEEVVSLSRFLGSKCAHTLVQGQTSDLVYAIIGAGSVIFFFDSRTGSPGTGMPYSDNYQKSKGLLECSTAAA